MNFNLELMLLNSSIKANLEMAQYVMSERLERSRDKIISDINQKRNQSERDIQVEIFNSRIKS